MTMGITYMKQLQEEHHAMSFHVTEVFLAERLHLLVSRQAILLENI